MGAGRAGGRRRPALGPGHQRAGRGRGTRRRPLDDLGQRRAERRLQEAGFPTQAPGGLQFEQSAVKAAQLHQLVKGEYIARAENVIFIGDSWGRPLMPSYPPEVDPGYRMQGSLLAQTCWQRSCQRPREEQVLGHGVDVGDRAGGERRHAGPGLQPG